MSRNSMMGLASHARSQNGPVIVRDALTGQTKTTIARPPTFSAIRLDYDGRVAAWNKAFPHKRRSKNKRRATTPETQFQ